MSVINQYSFVIFSAVVGLILALIMWRWQRASALLRVGIFAAYVVLIVGIHSFLGYSQNFDGKLQTVDATLENGQPTFLMLYSDY